MIELELKRLNDGLQVRMLQVAGVANLHLHPSLVHCRAMAIPPLISTRPTIRDEV